MQLTDKEKRKWFNEQIEIKRNSDPPKSEEELVEFIRFLRKTFKAIYGKDVPGSFIRILLKEQGIAREYGEGVQKKRDYIFKLLDENQAFRDNKKQLRIAVEDYFKEKILGIVFDEIWDEYFNGDVKKPKKNIDLFGQDALFN